MNGNISKLTAAESIAKIISGEIAVGKAECDSDGNNINETFAELRNNLNRLDPDVINMTLKDLVQRASDSERELAKINKAPEQHIPITSDVLESNTAYHVGECGDVRLQFPTEANDGDVIYVNFYSGEVSVNCMIITTNTSDIEVIPDANTGYEIYAKYVANIEYGGVGKWIVNYSEYTIGG